MIDQGLPEAWPPEVLEALARFKQGHLVVRPPVFYAAKSSYGIWDLTRDAGTTETIEDLFDLADDDRPPYGLITTQTCDLAEEGRPDHPWFQVVPVYRLDDISDADRQLLEDHRRSHLVLLDAPDLSDGTWVADLRIEMPIEKSWLVGLMPIEAFSDEGAYAVLAERLAARRDRPALATAAISTIVKPLGNWLKGNAGQREAAKVDQLRLSVAPSRLQVERAQLLILTNDVPLPTGDRVAWDRWWARTTPKAAEVGIDLLANQYDSYGTLSARDYRSSVPLDFGYLSRGI